MRIIFLMLFSILLGCKSEVKDTKSLEEVATLQSEIEQLKMDASLKDSMLNESLSFFNEIQENLVAINIKSEGLRQISANPEASNYDRAWMINEIKQINFLRAENGEKIKQLQTQLSSSNVNLDQLNQMMSALEQDVAMRDEQIAQLQLEMGKKDMEYTRLFDAYQEKEYYLESSINDLNTAYFVYGTEDELIKNGVIDRKNGFIGIGKKVQMKGNLNVDYFTKIDLRKKTEFRFQGKKAKIISIHPTQSYVLTANDQSMDLKVTNIPEFWKATKYLIVIVQ